MLEWSPIIVRAVVPGGGLASAKEAQVNATRERWQATAAAELPDESNVIARNAAITAHYTRWYLQYPSLFRWAGMAAFASHRVGIALLPYRFTPAPEGSILAHGPVSHQPRPLGLLIDVNVVRVTNNMVFADIGWVHRAYADPAGGIGAVEDGLADLPSHASLLQGFQLIDRARRACEANPADPEADLQLWEGARMILQHEQWFTVQGQFDLLDRPFSAFLSIATVLDFDAEEWWIDVHTFSSFYAYTWRHSGLRLLETASFPDIRVKDQRWAWIDNGLLPIWKRVVEKDPNLLPRMGRLIG
jgi:hypothetical protein